MAESKLGKVGRAWPLYHRQSMTSRLPHHRQPSRSRRSTGVMSNTGEPNAKTPRRLRPHILPASVRMACETGSARRGAVESLGGLANCGAQVCLNTVVLDVWRRRLCCLFLRLSLLHPTTAATGRHAASPSQIRRRSTVCPRRPARGTHTLHPARPSQTCPPDLPSSPPPRIALDILPAPPASVSPSRPITRFWSRSLGHRSHRTRASQVRSGPLDPCSKHWSPRGMPSRCDEGRRDCDMAVGLERGGWWTLVGKRKDLVG